jgi:Fic family protein
MDVDRFAASPVGHLVPIGGTDGRTGQEYRHVAFVPDPLPDSSVDLTAATWRAVARAEYGLGRLQQATRQVTTPLLHRATLRREAQSTSALEGTFAPLEEVLAADALEEDDMSAELREVVNYIHTAEMAFAWLADGRKPTTGFLCTLQKTLVRNTRSDTPSAGKVRDIPVAIGHRGAGTLPEARFVPPPPGLVLDAGLQDLVDWSNGRPADSDPVVDAALAHYQFETLHAFNDGNGRIGRLLVVLQLLQRGIISDPTLTVSAWFESRRTEYENLLESVSADGSWDEWVRFFAAGIEASAIDTAARVEQLLAVQESFRTRLRDASAKGIVRDVAEALVASPYVTIPGVARQTGKSFQAASNAVGKLSELGIVTESPGRHPRLFSATDVVRVLTRP